MTQHTSLELQSEAWDSADWDPADSQGDFDGELVTAPWLGLHYRSEAP